jgi:uncharacterized protein (DUF1778 family)
MSKAVRKEDRFDLRATPQQSTLIRRAAATAGRNYTDFILDSATDRAVDVLMDQRLFFVDEARWHRFEAALNAPAEPVAALVELFRDSNL